MQERRPIVQPISHVPIMYPVVFHDDASGTFNYQVTADGADYVAEFNTAAAYVNSKGLKLKTRTTGASIGDKVQIRKYVPIPPTQLARMRVMIYNPEASPDKFIYCFMNHHDGTYVHAGEVMLNTADEKVSYAATFRADYTDTGMTWSEDQYYWTFLDFTINPNTDKWHYIRVNNQYFDASGIDLAVAANAGAPGLRLYLHIETAANAAAEVDFDQLLITAENP